jgi:hypothetical protein
VSALVIGPDQKRAIADLVERAGREPVPFEVMKRLAAAHAEGRDTRELRNRNAGLTIDIPFGYAATLTIEEHKPGVLCRHLSVSSARPGRTPNGPAMDMLMEEFGFVNRLGSVPAFLEDLGQGRCAVNVIEPLDGDVDKLRADRGEIHGEEGRA